MDDIIIIEMPFLKKARFYCGKPIFVPFSISDTEKLRIKKRDGDGFGDGDGMEMEMGMGMGMGTLC